MGMIQEPVLRRCVAFLADLLLISILYTAAINFLPDALLKASRPLGRISFLPALSAMVQGPGSGNTSLDAPILYGILTVTYFLGADLMNQGNSPGKDILRMRTVGMDGKPPTVEIAMVRTLLKLVSISLLPVSIAAYFWKGRQVTLHDLFCNTSVKCGKPE